MKIQTSHHPWLMLFSLFFMHIFARYENLILDYEYSGNVLTTLKLPPKMLSDDFDIMGLQNNRLKPQWTAFNLHSDDLPSSANIRFKSTDIPQPLQLFAKSIRDEIYLAHFSPGKNALIVTADSLLLHFTGQFVWCLYGKQAMACHEASRLIAVEPTNLSPFLFFNSIDRSKGQARQLKTFLHDKALQFKPTCVPDIVNEEAIAQTTPIPRSM